MRRSSAPAYTGEGPHALWHVSEDASIATFVPHRAATAIEDTPFVWAIDTRHLPLYWFPRDCPRGTWWSGPETTGADRMRFLPGNASRVHAVQHDWLAHLRSARLFAYRLPEEGFVEDSETAGYWRARETVEPIEQVLVDDLLERHAAAHIELRVVADLSALWREVSESTLAFSGVRLRNL